MKPHVVIIMADQLRFDVLGKGYTPNIDALKKEGVSFERTYTSCPLCVPARGSFFTGVCPNRTGSLINPWEPEDAIHGDVKAEFDNLYTLMEADWDSMHSGKQHFYTAGGKMEEREVSATRWLSTEKSYQEYLAGEGISAPGGSRFRSRVPEMVGGTATRVSSYSNAETGCYEAGEEHYFDAYFARKALEGLRKRDKSKPLLLNAMFVAPHPPLQIPEPWYSKVAEGSFDLPENVGIFYPQQSPLQMYNLTGVVGSRYQREDWQEVWRVYLGLVAMLDDCVGMMIEELKNQEIYDDTLILFTSDHGEMLGSHGLFQKMCMYEESARVPLYIKFPQDFQPEKKVYKEAVSHLDVWPTLCEYLDISSRNRMDGISLLPMLRGESEGRAGRSIFIQYDGNGSRSNFQRCVVSSGHKLIADFFKDEVYYELYDIEKDPQETINLMFGQKHDETARMLRDALSLHMSESGDLLSMPVFDPETFRERYRLIPA